MSSRPATGSAVPPPWSRGRARATCCQEPDACCPVVGSTNPCPTAAHTEPFCTSVFKVLMWDIFSRLCISPKPFESPPASGARFSSPTRRQQVETFRGFPPSRDSAREWPSALTQPHGRQAGDIAREPVNAVLPRNCADAYDQSLYRDEFFRGLSGLRLLEVPLRWVVPDSTP